jgi:hypothetical protein
MYVLLITKDGRCSQATLSAAFCLLEKENAMLSDEENVCRVASTISA